MAEDKKQSNVRQEFTYATTGLNMDNTLNQIKKGSLTYALNAAVENYDANSVNYQNEEGNEYCLDFPDGYILIGKHYISEKKKHIFFLANPTTDNSQIGYMDNNDCVYKTLIEAPCLNFSIYYPIHKIAHKITNCTTEIYWTDGYNPRRHLDIDNVPKDLAYGSDLCDPKYSDQLDCNQLKLQPDFSIPKIKVTDVISGGDLIAGTYQFAVQYSDVAGNPFTSYYSVTNPTPIADIQLTTPNFDYNVGKSIEVDVSNLDVTGQFEHFNLAVIKTVNNISSVELVGTYDIEIENKQITYSGQGNTDIRLSIDDVFEKFPYYDIAQDVTAVQDIIVWDNLSSIDRVNYQQIASKIKLQWESWRIPADENYADEWNATNLKSYLRDEIYPFEIAFLLTNGKQTDGFHIPGREKSFSENHADVSENDPDFIGESDTGFSPYWKIYNTASVSGYSPDYVSKTDYKGPYQFGEFAYWESAETYPCNEDVWGDLAGEPIRHHKFPDVSVSPIFESAQYSLTEGFKPIMGDRAVYPIGVKINPNDVKTLIEQSNLTSEQKADIIGFKILRGNRSTSKSVIAKGILRNVGKYEREGNEYYYSNYPYNDLRKDPFLNSVNNAYDCISYNVTINSIGGSDGVAKIQYRDCSTNKEIIKEVTNLDTYQLCSTERPVILDSANGTVINTAYERYIADSIGLIVTFVYAKYTDAESGELVEKRLRNVDFTPGEEPEDEVFKVVPNTGGITVVDIDGNEVTNETLLEAINITELDPIGFDEAECGPENNELKITSDDDSKYRQIFNSPETSFGQPYLGDVLKLESVLFGGGKAHFVDVKNNAKYKLLTKEAQLDAIAVADSIGDITADYDITAFTTAYQAQLTAMINSVSRKNFAKSFNSIADYNYSALVPNDEGVKQRNLDISRYLIPSVVSTGDEININNYQRESSVYLKTDEDVTALPYPKDTPYINNGIVDNSRFTISEKGVCGQPDKQQDINVLSYYASIKNNIVNQWGQIYSYETIDTGYYSIFTDNETTVFGGDTFISRFAFKTKLPFFIDNRVGGPDDSDIFYDEIGNIAYPKYWHSARSLTESYVIGDPDDEDETFTLSNIISYKAHNFDCPNSQDVDAIEQEDIENGELEASADRIAYDGYFYLFAYGIPSFYCESSYNIDLRQAFNSKEGDFFPHVSSGIPDEWLQETFVSIAQDNTYYYNITFSKQNKENFFSHLPEDWDDECYTHYPFRAIYSEPQNIDSDNRVNSWLIYRPTSYFDFPQNYGSLTSLDGIQNKAILARFENKSLLYNNLLTIDTSNPQSAYLGNPSLFEGAPPIDFAETDLGYVGSQHKFLLKIPQGQITVDAKRGQVFLLSQKGATDLSGFGSGMNRFLTDHLPFNILKTFPDIEIDNAFYSIGLCGVYDRKYERVIITKLDYKPLSENISYESNNFYYTKTVNGENIRKKVYLTDTDYFCNMSWTLSFNMNTMTWISFHTYLPNFYIADNKFFYTGLKDCCSDFDFIVGVTAGGGGENDIDCELDDGYCQANPEDRPDCELDDASAVTVIDFSKTTSTTTSTTTAPIDCTLEDGYSQVSEDEEDCVRPEGVIQTLLIAGYGSTDSTGSQEDACDASTYIQENPLVSTITVQAEVTSVVIGNTVYAGFEGTDCECVDDGWYIINSTEVMHVVDCVIVAIETCLGEGTTTTTSTTQPPECTLANGSTTIVEFSEACEWNGGSVIVLEEGITTTTSTSSSTTTSTTTTP